jgi:hypothetical protein
VDAIIVAVYGNRINVSRRSRTEVLRETWESYTKKVVTSANPERVICVEKGVAGVVENDLQALFPGRYEVIPQPNAHLWAHGVFPEVLRDLQSLTLRCRYWRTRKSRVNSLPAKPLFTNRRYDLRARPGVGCE